MSLFMVRAPHRCTGLPPLNPDAPRPATSRCVSPRQVACLEEESQISVLLVRNRRLNDVLSLRNVCLLGDSAHGVGFLTQASSLQGVAIRVARDRLPDLCGALSALARPPVCSTAAH